MVRVLGKEGALGGGGDMSGDELELRRGWLGR